VPGREPLDEDALRAALGTRWNRVTVVADTPSTNTDLLRDELVPDRSVLVAELQTAGRGRLDRTWTSPRGAGLTFSVLLRPSVPMVFWSWLPLLAGLALSEAVRDTAAVPAGLKWPNDLVIEDRKAAGILAQAGADRVVVGIGLNVSTSADELPVPEATSLMLAAATDTDRFELLVAILSRLDARVAQWTDFGGDAEAAGLLTAYRECCATLGRHVAVTVGDETLHGEAVDIDPAGRLVLSIDGERRPLAAGDVKHVRPS
jgi:BirA family biotin operon repressor/biotin-[acetyl-CoA-carboxylase] ligase